MIPIIIDRPLSKEEKRKLHSLEQKVIYCYEKTTQRPFMRFELIELKKLIRLATPEQINSMIYRMYKLYPQNFKDFYYIIRPVQNMFRNKRGGNKK